MPPSARRRYTIALVGLVACKSDPPPPAPAPAAAPSPPAVVMPDAGPTTGGFKITISEAKPPGPGLAKRCTLDGDPLVADCVGPGSGVALDAHGTLYVVDGLRVRRYTRTADEGCHYVLAGDPIEMPGDTSRPQSMDKTVYMRSGGVEWHLVATSDAVYAHDFMAGLFRIDHGKPEPACPGLFGFKTIAARGKELLMERYGIQKLPLGKHCTPTSAKIDDKAQGDLVFVKNTPFIATFDQLFRYDGTTAVPIGDGSKICAVSAIAPCGDDSVCIMDTNCMHVLQFTTDGKVTRDLDAETLFGSRPWSLQDAATRPDGGLLVYVQRRENAGAKDVCEGSIYELPAALFAL